MKTTTRNKKKSLPACPTVSEFSNSCHGEYATKASEYKTKASECKTKPSEYKTKANEYETKANEYETKANEYKTKANEYETKASEYETKVSEYEIKANEYKTKPNMYGQCLIKNQGPKMLPRSYQRTPAFGPGQRAALLNTSIKLVYQFPTLSHETAFSSIYLSPINGHLNNVS